jgi:hypothetical protein
MTSLFGLEESYLTRRREAVFLVLSGLFLGSLVMLNILGITKFIDLSFELFSIKVPFVIAIGVLPYPVTFLCTDLISELYGKRRANLLVIVGLILNLWLIFILWVGGVLPPNDPNSLDINENGAVFYQIRNLSFSATFASMVAYLSAQFIDVYIFHYLKKLTKGKHLWLRNNGSTIISQLLDSCAVILITYYFANSALPIQANKPILGQLTMLILSGYTFKFVAALLDTLPFYFGTKQLKKYLHL